MARILVVDDDNDVRTMVTTILTTSGHEVVAAEGGERALELAVAEPSPHLILLDVMMPGIDGYTVLERLRADERTSEIPVVMVTARDDTRGLLIERARGAVGHLAKPFRIEELESAIAHALTPETDTERRRRELDAGAAQAHLDAAQLFHQDDDTE